jgi:hypothetical protein
VEDLEHIHKKGRGFVVHVEPTVQIIPDFPQKIKRSPAIFGAIQPDREKLMASALHSGFL